MRRSSAASRAATRTPIAPPSVSTGATRSWKTERERVDSNSRQLSREQRRAEPTLSYAFEKSSTFWLGHDLLADPEADQQRAEEQNEENTEQPLRDGRRRRLDVGEAEDA